MSRLCLSAALLLLLGTLMTSIPVVTPAARTMLTLYSSYNEYLHNGPGARAILAVLQPHFGLEPPYRGPCKSVNVRYFFNASSTFWEPFVYGGCDAKENNLLRAADLRRTCGGSLGH
nr:PREDICTED: serum basic protease inhibitor [Bos mutus]